MLSSCNFFSLYYNSVSFGLLNNSLPCYSSQSPYSNSESSLFSDPLWHHPPILISVYQSLFSVLLYIYKTIPVCMTSKFPYQFLCSNSHLDILLGCIPSSLLSFQTLFIIVHICPSVPRSHIHTWLPVLSNVYRHAL